MGAVLFPNSARLQVLRYELCSSTQDFHRFWFLITSGWQGRLREGQDGISSMSKADSSAEVPVNN
jgi:hypothetical protein